jgi:hypothetical protein
MPDRIEALRETAVKLGMLRPTEQNLEAFQKLMADAILNVAEELEYLRGGPKATVVAKSEAPAETAPAKPGKQKKASDGGPKGNA